MIHRGIVKFAKKSKKKEPTETEMDKFIMTPPKLGFAYAAGMVLILVEKLALIGSRVISFYYILKLIFQRKRLSEKQINQIHDKREVFELFFFKKINKI